LSAFVDGDNATKAESHAATDRRLMTANWWHGEFRIRIGRAQTPAHPLDRVSLVTYRPQTRSGDMA